MGASLTADDGSGAAAGHAADLHDRRDHAVGGVAVVEPRRDQQLAGLAGLGGVDCSAGGVVEFDRHHHSGQHDRLAHEQHRHRDWFRHQSSKVESDALNPWRCSFVPSVALARVPITNVAVISSASVTSEIAVAAPLGDVDGHAAR